MIAALPTVAGHSSEELIRDDDHEWMVRTRFGGRWAATRIARLALPDTADGQLRASVLNGAPLDEALPWELRRILEGHRVRASLPAEWPLPTVLAAGLAENGHPYVTRAWVDGVPMAVAWPSCAPDVREDALEQLLWLIERLHTRGVIIQDLKPDNVVLDVAGGVWLVDLESLRISPSGAVPCTHYTPRYAAPEQLVGRSSALASDVFAFGRMVTELSGGNPGPRWAALATACQSLDPRLRPTAPEAIRWLHGAPPGPESTIRVPEPDATNREALTPPAAPALPPTVPAVVPPKSQSPWRILGVLGAVGALALAGLGLQERQLVEDLLSPAPAPVANPGPKAPSPLVGKVRDGLRAHKVVAAKNNEQELARLLVVARQAAVIDPSADALGEVALATVWSQRWHWKGARWDAAAFEIADRATRAASAAGETPEGVLARGLAAAAACRHGPETLRGRDRWCTVALTQLDRAAKIGPDWLVVEAQWGAVMVDDTLAMRALDAGGSATRETADGLARCDRAEPLLASAPVNGIELVEDCVWTAAAARDQSAWHRWTGWWITHRKGPFDAAATAFLVRSAAPECARLPVDADGLPTVLDEGSWGAWCAAMTQRTLRCVNDPPGHRPGWCPE